MFTRTLVASALLAGFFTGSAFAGECPQGQMRVDATKPSTAAAKGVTDKVLATIDLSKEKVALNGHMMRVRRLEIQPGGIVPLHSHADRPALIMVNAGEIYENSSKCLVPILHHAGDISREYLGTQHWWKNEGKTTVVLTIADIVNDHKPETMMQHM